MPWWVYTYFLGFGVFTGVWMKSELKDREEHGYLLAELASDACMVLAALAYWLPSVRFAIAPAAGYIFVAGLAWVAVAAVREWHRYSPDLELSGSQNILAVSAGLLLYGLISGPMLYWGFMYSVLGNVAGT